MKGKVVIVGAGPGDPELITVKGLKALRSADVVVYDRLAPRGLIAEVKEGCELIYAGKEPGRAELSQDEINRILAAKALEGKLVVRLKGGDPYVFGRGEEECEYVMSAGVPCEVVPGIPSFIGASAYAGIPLAGRGFSSAFSVVTGQVADRSMQEAHLDRIERLAAASDMLVILMGVRELSRILRSVARVKEPKEPAAAVMWATTPQQRVVAGALEDLIAQVEAGNIQNPAVIYVGRGVTWRGRLWRADAL